MNPLSPDDAAIYRRCYHAALKGGCDTAQARSIASERTLQHIMVRDATQAALKDRLANYAVVLE